MSARERNTCKNGGIQSNLSDYCMKFQKNRRKKYVETSQHTFIQIKHSLTRMPNALVS